MFLDFLKKTFCREKTPDKPKEKRKRGKHSRANRVINREVAIVTASVNRDALGCATHRVVVSRWPGNKAIKILKERYGLLCTGNELEGPVKYVKVSKKED